MGAQDVSRTRQRRLLSYVDANNFDSLRSCWRMSFQDVVIQYTVGAEIPLTEFVRVETVSE